MTFTYFPYVKCEVSQGVRDDEFTAAVTDVDGIKQFLPVGKSFIQREGGQNYLPIGIIRVERQKQHVLIELPIEADSGVNRLWVRFESLQREEAVA